jgi:NAD(P)-dependent dehydrogenase (short-subunit alcohol dehydrogenase family)
MDLFSIEGKTAVVTGGSRGIGFMIARGYVEAGARVYISARKADACDAAAKELSAIGECISIPADLATDEGARRLVDGVSARESELHILVNNAGATWGAPLEEYPDAGFDKVLQINVKGVFAVTRLFLPLLRKAARDHDPARVINIGSVEGLRPPSWENYAYPASKAAVHMLTRHLAQRLVGDGIAVNAVAPGLFPSKMTQFIFDAAENAVRDTIPMGRPGEPEDMAGIAIFLASRASAYLTGAVIPVDGGVSTTR